MRFLRQSLTGLFLLSLTVGLLFYAITIVMAAVQERNSQEGRRPSGRERVFTVAVVVAEPETVVPVLTVFGQIESRRSLVVRSAVAGTVVELADNFEEGGVVEAGQLLLRIDPADAQSAVDRSNADLLDAQAEQRDADRGVELARDELDAAQEQTALRQRAFERQKDLATRGVVTEASVEAAELSAASARQAVVARRQSVASAEARIDKAVTSLARAQIAHDENLRNLKDTEIRAEFTGRLNNVNVVAGGRINSNDQLAELIDGSALDVAFRVSTAQYARLLDDTGALRPAPMKAILDGSGVDLSVSGRLSRDSAAVGEGVTGRLLFATLDGARGLKPGDFVSVEVDEPALERVVRLPSRALGADGAVLVMNDDGRLESQDVTLLRRQGDDILVRGRGLAGRQIVAERTPLLGAGIKVKSLAPAGTGAAPAAPAEPELVELSDERRAKLLAFVEGNRRMPAEVKSRMLTALKEPKVPANVVQRLESRMGG